MHRDIYIFMGPPGAGKGTLSASCIREFGWRQLSTGDLCREQIAAQTEIGKQIDFIIKSGKLISDSLIAAMVEEWLALHKGESSPLILDGFPRTVVQARMFHQALQAKGLLSRVRFVLLEVPDDVVIRRLVQRALCSNKGCQAIYSLEEGSGSLEGKVCQKCGDPLVRRADDQEETIRARLAVYHEHAHDMLRFFEENGYECIKIKGDGSVDAVFSLFKKKIGI